MLLLKKQGHCVWHHTCCGRGYLGSTFPSFFGGKYGIWVRSTHRCSYLPKYSRGTRRYIMHRGSCWCSKNLWEIWGTWVSNLGSGWADWSCFLYLCSIATWANWVPLTSYYQQRWSITRRCQWYFGVEYVVYTEEFMSCWVVEQVACYCHTVVPPRGRENIRGRADYFGGCILLGPCTRIQAW